MLCIVLGVCSLLIGAYLPIGQAFQFDNGKLRLSMQQHFGTPGILELERWLSFIESQQGRTSMEQINAVNDFWNQTALAGADLHIWGVEDYWATPMETLGRRMADCEDFVIGKYVSLLRLGLPAENMRFIYVRARQGGIGSDESVAHMVLGYYPTPKSEPYVLDNLVPTLMPAGQRSDLTPVFSFNAYGIYAPNARQTSVERIGRWNELIARMLSQGFSS